MEYEEIEGSLQNHNYFLVKSQANGEQGKKYFVSLSKNHPACQCLDWFWTGQVCKHILACKMVQSQG